MNAAADAVGPRLRNRLPDLIERTVAGSGVEDEGRLAHQVLFRNVTPVPAVLRIVTVIAHAEIMAGRYDELFSVVVPHVVAVFDDVVLHAVGQGLDILRKRSALAFVVPIFDA